MIHDESNCPWGPGEADLSQRILSREDKIWIGNVVNSKSSSGSKIAKKI